MGSNSSLQEEPLPVETERERNERREGGVKRSKMADSKAVMLRTRKCAREKSRKQMKERKNKPKKIRGVKKTKAGDVAKVGKRK
ncbi:hypothetical protein FCM35_KLT02124 [Carex littledalei]|uniref:Uncharacterized protein n=1 Tax=Carex littledalei TaxID=544730 RepID=A0A833VBL0_9POAL|nr:hypothetical protein FCM35_KLT02124 [Carex littledalei]